MRFKSLKVGIIGMIYYFIYTFRVSLFYTEQRLSRLSWTNLTTQAYKRIEHLEFHQQSFCRATFYSYLLNNCKFKHPLKFITFPFHINYRYLKLELKRAIYKDFILLIHIIYFLFMIILFLLPSITIRVYSKVDQLRGRIL